MSAIYTNHLAVVTNSSGCFRVDGISRGYSLNALFQRQKKVDAIPGIFESSSAIAGRSRVYTEVFPEVLYQ